MGVMGVKRYDIDRQHERIWQPTSGDVWRMESQYAIILNVQIF
jgi:hypothetical protein